MIPLTIILLFTSSAIAQLSNDYRQDDNVNNQMENMYNRDLRRPSNLYYNFEHLRNDQPAHVDIRDEDMGKYMNKKSTTTHATPIVTSINNYPEHFSDFQRKQVPMPRDNQQLTKTIAKPYDDQNWNQIINNHLPASLPPPPSTPKWMDLSGTYQEQQPSYYSSNANYDQYYQPNLQTVKPTQAPAFQWAKHGIMPNNNQYEQVPHSDQQRRDASNDLPFLSRGNHKFDWPNKSKLNTPQDRVSTKHGQPPSSVPTLSPWSGDDFGK
ncbi:uncharacterized protein LOC131854991 [Achroia grisella]|uniref:uncharacterized protein LOC131854991 n=1 Tax=Achroia grisella TaxID=688607 RepID=UPI0027D2A03B|nr:uncharacterized protein LOC131854991 [Achroia grisella]